MSDDSKELIVALGTEPLKQCAQFSASLKARLGAASLDAIFFFILIAPATVFAMANRDTFQLGDPSLPYIIGSLLVWLGVQSSLIAATGQSLGKRFVRIRITRANGASVGFVHGVLLRWWLVLVLGCIPSVGGLLRLVDTLAIFSSPRRCLHDRLADTIVVSLRPPSTPGLS